MREEGVGCGSSVLEGEEVKRLLRYVNVEGGGKNGEMA